MDNKMKKKNIILSLVIVLVGLLIAGGTYAYFTLSLNVINNIVNGSTTCLNVDYTDNTNQIAGTLFPSSGPNKGLVGSVTLKINNACDLSGIGTLYLHINLGTSTKFGTVVSPHCENSQTLVTLPEYTNSSDCTGNDGTWKTDGTPLKFAVYDNNSFTGTPLAVGNFDNQLIGADAPFYSNFYVGKSAKTLYIYVWLDGYLTDNTYTDLPFDGYIYTSVMQNQNLLPSEYQRVEYISGASRIITDIIPADNRGIYAKIQNNAISTSSDNIPYVYFGSSNSGMNGIRFYATMRNGNFSFGWNSSEYGSIEMNTTDINIIKLNYLNSRTLELNDQVIASNIPTLSTSTYPVHLFGQNRGGNNTNMSKSYKLYEFKVSEGSNIIADYIPCYRKSDNVVGLYDTKSDTFYTKVSGSAFGKGPNVN